MSDVVDFPGTRSRKRAKAAPAEDITETSQTVAAEWAKTDRGGRQYPMFREPSMACNQWGVCE
jgi:uncharacterized protein (DUF736 family)